MAADAVFVFLPGPLFVDGTFSVDGSLFDGAPVAANVVEFDVCTLLGDAAGVCTLADVLRDSKRFFNGGVTSSPVSNGVPSVFAFDLCDNNKQEKENHSY